MNELTIAPARQADLPALAALCKDAPDPWSEADFLPELTKSGSLLLTAQMSGEPVAFACFWQEEDAAELALVAVGKKARRQGAAEKLLQEAFDRLFWAGVRRVVLEVRVSNAPARALYAALGFQTLARRKALYQSPAEDGLCMEKELLCPAGHSALE